MAFKKVARVSEIKEGKIKGAQVNGEPVALYNIGGEIFATTDVCTHAACSLAENGVIEPSTGPSTLSSGPKGSGQESGEIVGCLCHGSRFRIKTGEVTVPPAFEPLKTYKVKVEGEDVWVEV